MTGAEMLSAERAAVARLRTELAARMAELEQAEQNRERSIDSAAALAHARLGVKSARRLLKAHLDSMEIIQRRKEHDHDHIKRTA